MAVLAFNERENLRALLPDLHRALTAQGISCELLVLDGGSTDGTVETAVRLDARVHVQKRPGYGGALAEALQVARGRYVLTMDADLSHPAPFISDLWNARDRGDIIVASRYVSGAKFEAPLVRKVLSRLLNLTFRRLLSLPVRDLSSGFRLYRKQAVRAIPIMGTNFESLQELLIKALLQGRRVDEIPFHYAPRRSGRSHVHFLKFAICFLRTLYRMWALRSSTPAANRDERSLEG